MAKTYKELLEEDFARQIEFNNVKKYHEAGYTGKGVTIFNAEDYVDHGVMTTSVINDYAPEVNVINGVFQGRVSGNDLSDYGISIDGEKITIEEAIERHNIKIFTSSHSGSFPTAVLDYYKELQEKYGVIFLCSAGNKSEQTGIWANHNTAITVSACKLYDNGEIKISYFGSQGEVDFTNFMARGRGTSASSPVTSAEVALLLQKYGDFSHSECIEILKNISIKLPNIEDYKQGWGLPVLPLTDKLEILEKLRGENMNFKDVEQDRWSKPAIDYCVEQGTLQGFPDGTFKPAEPMTREQYAQAEYNKAKREGRI